MPTYNVTQIAENATTMTGFIQAVNNGILGGLLGLGLLMLIGFVSVIAFFQATNDLPKSVGGTSGILFVLGILFFALGIIPVWALYVCIVGCGLAILFLFRGQD